MKVIVFPTVTATLPIDVGEEDRVVSRREGEFGRVGVVAEVIERGRSPRGNPIATTLGLHRGLAGVAVAGEDAGADSLRIEVQEIHDGHPEDEQRH